MASLKSGAQGKEVKNINDCLALLLKKDAALIDANLLDPVLNANQLTDLVNGDIEQYGPVTESLILLFQKSHRIAETGEIDEETAAKLNAVLNNMGVFDRRVPADHRSCLDEYLPAQKVVDFDVLQKVQGIVSRLEKVNGENEVNSSHLLRLSIKDGEYTYAKPDDIIMIESSDHLTIVHVAQQIGKVKTTLRSSSLKDFLLALPKNCFLRVNRFCAVNLNRLSGGSYHQQFFEFDHSIKLKPKHHLSHAIFSSIGK